MSERRTRVLLFITPEQKDRANAAAVRVVGKEAGEHTFTVLVRRGATPYYVTCWDIRNSDWADLQLAFPEGFVAAFTDAGRAKFDAEGYVHDSIVSSTG